MSQSEELQPLAQTFHMSVSFFQDRVAWPAVRQPQHLSCSTPPNHAHAISVISLLISLTATVLLLDIAAAAAASPPVSCPGGRQKDFVDTERSLGRSSPEQISALVGYAGGQVRGGGQGSAGHVAGGPIRRLLAPGTGPRCPEVYIP